MTMTVASLSTMEERVGRVRVKIDRRLDAHDLADVETFLLLLHGKLVAEIRERAIEHGGNEDLLAARQACNALLDRLEMIARYKADLGPAEIRYFLWQAQTHAATALRCLQTEGRPQPQRRAG